MACQVERSRRRKRANFSECRKLSLDEQLFVCDCLNDYRYPVTNRNTLVDSLFARHEVV